MSCEFFISGKCVHTRALQHLKHLTALFDDTVRTMLSSRAVGPRTQQIPVNLTEIPRNAESTMGGKPHLWLYLASPVRSRIQICVVSSPGKARTNVGVERLHGRGCSRESIRKHNTHGCHENIPREVTGVPQRACICWLDADKGNEGAIFALISARALYNHYIRHDTNNVYNLVKCHSDPPRTGRVLTWPAIMPELPEEPRRTLLFRAFSARVLIVRLICPSSSSERSSSRIISANTCR